MKVEHGDSTLQLAVASATPMELTAIIQGF
jgi:hypothetical protein